MSNWWKSRYAQAITGIYVDRCDPNAIVWAQLANAEFLQALISYGSPGWKDIIDMGTGRSWLKHARSRMKEAHHTTPKWLTETGAVLGDTAEWLDKTAWLLMVIETFGGAALKWASAAYQVSPCEAAPEYGYWSSTEPLGFYDNQEGWAEGPIWITNKGNQGTVVSSELHLPAGNQGYLYCAVNYGKFIGLGGLYGWSSRMRQLGGAVLSQNDYKITPSGTTRGPIDFHWLAAQPQDRIIVYEWKPDIRGGFTETYAMSGAAGAAWHRPGIHKKGTLISMAPKAYNFQSVLDPQFRPVE